MEKPSPLLQTFFCFFSMTQPRIEPWSPRPLVNTTHYATESHLLLCPKEYTSFLNSYNYAEIIIIIRLQNLIKSN